MDTGVLLSLLALAGSGVGVYVAIRADLARLHERTITTQARAENAHQRLDALIMVRRT